VRSGARLWNWAAVGLTLVQIAASAFLRRGLLLMAVNDIVAALLILGLTIVFAGNAARSHGRLRSVWILLAFCWFLRLIGQGGWVTYDVVLRKPMPEMFPGDAVLFLAGVPMLAGFLLRPHLEPTERSVRLGLLDFLQLMLWWIYFYVYLVICWQYVSEDTDLYNRNYDQLFLVQVLALASVLVLLLMQSAGAWRRFYAYFLGAVAFNWLSVAAANKAIEAKTYYSGCWYDIPFTASFVFFMLVAVKGRDLAPVPEAAKDRRYGSWMANLAMVAVLSLPVIAAATILDKRSPSVIVEFRLLCTAATMFVVSALVFVKQRRLHVELRKSNKTLEEASMTDPLTGIRNRRFFSASIEGDVAQTLRAFAECPGRSDRDLVFYLIDMDNFKEINDVYGHDAGDRMLVETTRRIASAIRDSDVLLRWGGEEFLVVSRAADRRKADSLALRVMQAVRGEPFAVNASQPIRRTCSIGWAAFPWSEDNVTAMGYEEVLNRADRALGFAKRAGKDQVVGMNPALEAQHSAGGPHRDSELFVAKALRRAEAIDLELSGLR
jgi:diguanylate cyclase (GGDEF)-like protein